MIAAVITINFMNKGEEVRLMATKCKGGAKKAPKGAKKPTKGGKY